MGKSVIVVMNLNMFLIEILGMTFIFTFSQFILYRIRIFILSDMINVGIPFQIFFTQNMLS